MSDYSSEPTWTPPRPQGAAADQAFGGASGPRASFGQRFVGWLIDLVLLGVVGVVIRALIGVPAGTLVSTVVNFAYFGYFEGGPSGQTVGKRAIGIRVIRYDTGGPLGWGTALIRNVCRIVSALPCLLGYFWMLWDKEKMTWHDKLSNTVVVPVTAYPPPPDSFGQPPAS